MSIHELVHQSQQNIPSNQQPRNQYPEDIEAEIPRRVKEQLNKERERTMQTDMVILPRVVRLQEELMTTMRGALTPPPLPQHPHRCLQLMWIRPRSDYGKSSPKSKR
ncbi:hypothetical protein LIER_17084 [Lithospermum erythrorhizon]|uniref:Uncharacterized protein n=1 Tax=Lithospermum erythrorhizon TaxID=34254 RepID=A0AAV3Q914_LITER